MSPPAKVTGDQVRTAMERLLSGRSLHTDGELTVENLAAEAATSRQTLYRAHAGLVAEFREHAKRIAAAVEHPDRAARELRLRSHLADAKARSARHLEEARRWKAKAEQLASQVAYLAAQNEALRERSASVTAIKPVRPR